MSKINKIISRSIIFIFLIFFYGCVNYGNIRFGKDVYQDFAEISANYVEGRDYSVEIYDRNSKVSVLAIHGGELEEATSLIARNIAGDDFNLYIFNVWLGNESRKLHITASHFDDVKAINLVEKSDFSISIHGYAEKGEIVCIGGKDEILGRIISEFLLKNGFKTEFPCKRLSGKSEKNIVNKTRKDSGVQLEITLGLLKELEKDRNKLLKFTKIIRESVFECLK